MDVIKFIDSSGQKRVGTRKQCPICNKHFVTRKDQPYVACSKECRGKLRTRASGKVVECAQCGKNFIKANSKQKSKSGLYFCCRRCKDDAQKIGGIQAIMPAHYGTATGEWTYREHFSHGELICARCGYNEFSCGVAIHHIDHNRKNNNKSNLVPLCMPCHMALHYNFWKFEELDWEPYQDT